MTDPARIREALWSFDIDSAPEGAELLVYGHDGPPMPWGYGVRAIASKEDGVWYGADGDEIRPPACWTLLADKPPPPGADKARETLKATHLIGLSDWSFLPKEIGRLKLGDRHADNEGYCHDGHVVPDGAPLYWPRDMGANDDSDPRCLEHAIDLAESDSGWCQTCISRDLAAKPDLIGLSQGEGGDDGTEALIGKLDRVYDQLTPGAIERADLDGMAETVRDAQHTLQRLHYAYQEPSNGTNATRALSGLSLPGRDERPNINSYIDGYDDAREALSAPISRDADVREAIRKAKFEAETTHGIAWHNLEEVSRFELFLAALSTPSDEWLDDKADKLTSLMTSAMVVITEPSDAAPSDWNGQHVLMQEGSYLRNPGDYGAWRSAHAYVPSTPEPGK